MGQVGWSLDGLGVEREYATVQSRMSASDPRKEVKYCFGGQNAVRGDAAAASAGPHVARDGRSTVASSTCPRKTHLRPQDTSAFDPSK